MGKKLDVREYEAELIKVLDGDTIDCYIDLGFDLKIKKRIRYMGIDTWESRTRDLDAVSYTHLTLPTILLV